MAEYEMDFYYKLAEKQTELKRQLIAGEITMKEFMDKAILLGMNPYTIIDKMREFMVKFNIEI